MNPAAENLNSLSSMKSSSDQSTLQNTNGNHLRSFYSQTAAGLLFIVCFIHFLFITIDMTNSSFLQNSSVVITGLVPDEHGVVFLEAKYLPKVSFILYLYVSVILLNNYNISEYCTLEVCAIGTVAGKHEEECVFRSFWIPEISAKSKQPAQEKNPQFSCRDMVLKKVDSLPVDVHLCEHRKTALVYDGRPFSCEVTSNFRMEIYDNFSKAFCLMDALRDHEELFNECIH